MLWEDGQSFARGQVPAEILPLVRLVPLGGTHDCTTDQSPTEKATAPFECALTTRTGVECVAHVIQTLTELDDKATVLSVKGVGAFDLISRATMLEGMRGIEGGDSVLPLVSQFYSSTSTYLWEDESFDEIIQGEGGEQGDPLMPALFAVGQHRALVAISERSLPHEHLTAFLTISTCVVRSVLSGFRSIKAKLRFGTQVIWCQTTLMCCRLQLVWYTLRPSCGEAAQISPPSKKES